MTVVAAPTPAQRAGDHQTGDEPRWAPAVGAPAPCGGRVDTLSDEDTLDTAEFLARP